jgi:hypothetical protein
VKIAFTRELVNHFYKKLQDRRHKIQDKRDKERFDRLSDRRFYGQAARSGIAPYRLCDRSHKSIIIFATGRELSMSSEQDDY